MFLFSGLVFILVGWLSGGRTHMSVVDEERESEKRIYTIYWIIFSKEPSDVFNEPGVKHRARCQAPIHGNSV